MYSFYSHHTVLYTLKGIKCLSAAAHMQVISIRIRQLDETNSNNHMNDEDGDGMAV